MSDTNRVSNQSIKKIAPVAATAFVAAMLVGGFSFTTTVWAAVSFDPDNGTGFVGKGDIQTAFGWNNAQLQQNAEDVSFSTVKTATYDVVCQWVTGEGTRGEKTHQVTQEETTEVNSDVVHKTRTNPQSAVTGFQLTGFGDTTTSGDVPSVGDSCLGEGAEGTVQSVNLVSESGVTLIASFGGNDVTLGTF